MFARSPKEIPSLDRIDDRPGVAVDGAVAEQRRETHYPAADRNELAPPPRRQGTAFATFRFKDIFSARHHTNDFKDSRADYINTRLSFMALFFALAVPTYALVDYFTLSQEHFASIGWPRVILTLVHGLVFVITLRKLSIIQVNILLGLDILAAALFSVASLYMLQKGAAGAAPLGYVFTPFMIITMLGLFPLTLVSGSLIMALVVAPHIGLQLWLNGSDIQGALNMSYLFALFMGIVLWLQTGQLLMLLKLYRESTRDILTGLINRRVLMRFLDDEINENRDKGRCFCILMIDLDRFKVINDTHGHFTGDLVLKAAARLLENELRLSDIVARFGGEEFVAVLPGLEIDEALAVAERICKTCTKTRVLANDGNDVTFTASIGVAEYIAGERIEATLKRADEALYTAKQQGRNQVIYGRPVPRDDPIPSLA